MNFEKLSITEEQRDKYFSARQKGLLKRDDMHVFAMLEDDVIQSMAMLSKDHTFEDTYIIHDLFLKEDADTRYLAELILNIEKTCQSVGAHYITCRIQGNKVETAFYAKLLLDQEYHFVYSGFKLFYALEELVDCRLMEASDEIRNLVKYVMPYSSLTNEQKHNLVNLINASPEYNLNKTPDPEFGLAVIVNETIIAYMDARKGDEGTIYVPPVYLWKHKYTSYARAMIMMYMIDKAKNTMQEDTVIACETYTDTVYQQCFDWFGIPEKEESIIEMIKVI